MCEHHQTVERFVAQASSLHHAVAGLTPAQLDAFPVPGTWSVRQIVVHLLDSDLAAGHRMKRTIAEDKPLVIAYDETAFAQKLGYERLDVHRVAELFRIHREHIAELLRPLPAAAFDRALVHNQRGLVTLGRLVALYVEHVDHHFKFIRQKRQMLGVPLPA
ncbi:MAG: DinB family protein [Phycisphaerales bacterium]|nr:DinB family protein [Phycisphaerales bacterium]